ncbi:MAG: Ku protein [Clostridiaceae bacterium]
MSANSRTIWNGAISFGLVNIPVGLLSATKETGLDFDWIDKRTMDLVGYKRINKNTGEDIEKENIVRGIAYEKGKYVILSDEEIRSSLVRSTQTIELEAFVSADEIRPEYFEKPYYIAPGKNAEKSYTLLRETLLKTKRVGIARIVLHNKQHAAAILPEGRALVLILLRWEHQIRNLDETGMPAEGTAGLTEKEISMAEQLVGSMVEKWEPGKMKDSFTDKVMALVDEKVKKGQIESVLEPGAGEEAAEGAGVIDFTELLRKSLQSKTVGKAKKIALKAKQDTKSGDSEKAIK